MFPDIIGYKLNKACDILKEHGFSKLHIMVTNKPGACHELNLKDCEFIRLNTEEDSICKYSCEFYSIMNIDEVINFPDNLRIIRIGNYTDSTVELLACRTGDTLKDFT